jgi:hypothetical protein
MPSDREQLASTADVQMVLTLVAGAIPHRIVLHDRRITPARVKRLVTLVERGLLARGMKKPPWNSGAPASSSVTSTTPSPTDGIRRR